VGLPVKLENVHRHYFVNISRIFLQYQCAFDRLLLAETSLARTTSARQLSNKPNRITIARHLNDRSRRTAFSARTCRVYAERRLSI